MPWAFGDSQTEGGDLDRSRSCSTINSRSETWCPLLSNWSVHTSIFWFYFPAHSRPCVQVLLVLVPCWKRQPVFLVLSPPVFHLRAKRLLARCWSLEQELLVSPLSLLLVSSELRFRFTLHAEEFLPDILFSFPVGSCIWCSSCLSWASWIARRRIFDR